MRRCDYCNHQFNQDEEKYNQHLNDNHPYNCFQCSSCPKEFYFSEYKSEDLAEKAFCQHEKEHQKNSSNRTNKKKKRNKVKLPEKTKVENVATQESIEKITTSTDLSKLPD
jgi:hypothetical protein